MFQCILPIYARHYATNNFDKPLKNNDQRRWGDYIRPAGFFVPRYTILHHFKTKPVINNSSLKLFVLVLPCWPVFEKGASSVDRTSSPHVISQPGVSMTQRNNKKIQTTKNSLKNIFANNTSTLQHLQIQTLNLNGRMALLKIYLELLVILRQ